MINEARKRDHLANALLAVSFAANAAQSPKDFLRSGNIEGPGLQVMSRMMKKRAEAERNLDSPRVSEPARNRKKKTFEEFVAEAYLIERGQPIFSSRAELEKHYGGVPAGMVANNSTRADNPKWRLVKATNRKAQSQRKEKRKIDLTSSEDMKRGNKKEKKLKSVGLETHHITPLHYSAKLKASMSPEQWAERVRSDAEQGVYHGHHHKNLMGTVGPNTPKKRRIRTAIQHRAGGAHELEGNTKDIVSRGVPHKDLLSAAHRKEMRKQAEERKKANEEFILECYDLEESSGDERTRGRATLGRAGNKMTRQERTTASVAKKAGIKGTGKLSTKDLRKPARDYTTYDSEDTEDDAGSTEQDHFIRTYSSARAAAKGERLISKMKPAGRTPTGMTKLKTSPSSESVRKVKDLKKQMTKSGASKTGKVHTVDIMHRDGNVGKGDRSQQMERGRNFIQAVKDTPKHLKKAGAKPGDTVIGKPTAVMPGEDAKTGEAKRAKLYKKIFGKRSSKASPKTGLMTGKVD